jgi:hypothetical protein
LFAPYVFRDKDGLRRMNINESVLLQQVPSTLLVVVGLSGHIAESTFPLERFTSMSYDANAGRSGSSQAIVQFLDQWN